MLKPVLFSVALATTSFASATSAANLDIIFVDGGFFPEVTYLQPGDTATFINEEDGPRTAEATDQSWSTGSLSVNGTYILSVASDTVLSFTVAGDASKAGQLSFDLAPLSEVNGGDGEDGTSTVTD